MICLGYLLCIEKVGAGKDSDMKSVYLLKKGLQHYPPCLFEVLTLSDAGKSFAVYHGKNTPYIDALLDARGIEHHTLLSDKNPDNEKLSKLNRVKLFLEYAKEARGLVSRIPEKTALWLGNAETAAPLSPRFFEKRHSVFSVLELYKKGEYLDRRLSLLLPLASSVLAREPHRASLMRLRYGLRETPFVAENKPYDRILTPPPPLPSDVLENITLKKEERMILYQGIVSSDRPLDTVAAALQEIGDRRNILFVLGRADDSEKKRLLSLWRNTRFLGYIPAPLHLAVTARAALGIAFYDHLSENNLFCAPNKIYEYARFGVPMLASANPGLTETVGAYGAGVCVDLYNISSVRDAILAILSDRYTYEVGARRMYRETRPEKAILAAASRAKI